MFMGQGVGEGKMAADWGDIEHAEPTAQTGAYKEGLTSTSTLLPLSLMWVSGMSQHSLSWTKTHTPGPRVGDAEGGPREGGVAGPDQASCPGGWRGRPRPGLMPGRRACGGESACGSPGNGCCSVSAASLLQKSLQC